MSKYVLKFKKEFPKLSPKEIDDCLNKTKTHLPQEFVLFLKNNGGGYLEDNIGIRIGKELHGGVMLLGFSPSNMSENIIHFNKMRKSDPINQSDRYFTIMLIDGGEICIDTSSGGYSFFDASYCEFNALCSSLDDLLNCFEYID